MNKIFLFLFLILIPLFLPQKIIAAPPPPSIDVYNVSNTSYSEKWFTIYKDTVYWLDAYKGIIYGYNFTEQKNTPLFENQPVLPNLFSIVAYDGRYLVYNSYDDVSYNVNAYDMKENKNIFVTEGVGSRWAYDFDNNTVVYLDGGACGKLFAYHLFTKENVLINELACGGANISNDMVVWTSAIPNGSSVYAYDLRSKKRYIISAGEGNRSVPDIYNNTVIWYLSLNNGSEIHTMDILTKKEKIIFNSTTYPVSGVVISKKYAVWGQNISQHIAGIEGIDLKTNEIFQIQEPGPHQNANMSPQVVDNIVAWMAWRTGNGDIYGAIINR